VNPAAARRAELWIAAAVLVVGLWGLVLARQLSLTASRGARIADSVQFSPLGALVVVVLAAVALAGAALGAQKLVLASGAGFAAIAIVTLALLGRQANWLGARGSNVSLLVGAAVGLVVLAAAPREQEATPEHQPDQSAAP
jgi:hypothetical protein